MYNTTDITNDMLKFLEQSYPKNYEKYMDLRNRGVEFSVTQFFIYFLPRGYGKSFMFWLDSLYTFIKSDRQNLKITISNDNDNDLYLLRYILDKYFTDLKIVENKKTKIVLSK